MQAFMMITALAWPIIGGALAGLVAGIVKKHGLVGTIIDAVVGGFAGFAATMLLMKVLESKVIGDQLALALTLLTPVVGGLIGLALKSRVTG